MRCWIVLLLALDRLLIDNVEHLPLDGLLLQDQSILVPDKVWIFSVVAVSLHAAFE